MDELRDALRGIGAEVQQTLDGTDEARQDAYPRCRDIIRHSASAIRATHRKEMEEATRLLEQLQEEVAYLSQRLQSHPQIYHAGMVYDAQKEFAEAALTYALLTESELPTPESLKIEPRAFVSGLAEAVGELRRAALDHLTNGEIDQARHAHNLMDEIYFVLVGFDYPDAVLPGFKRRLDMVRGVLERTRADVYHGQERTELARRLDETLRHFRNQ